jgi:hypothetical protein
MVGAGSVEVASIEDSVLVLVAGDPIMVAVARVNDLGGATPRAIYKPGVGETIYGATLHARGDRAYAIVRSSRGVLGLAIDARGSAVPILPRGGGTQ